PLSLPYVLFRYPAAPPRDPHPFPTRRSSDLAAQGRLARLGGCRDLARARQERRAALLHLGGAGHLRGEARHGCAARERGAVPARSEEHTSELQSRFDLVCRLLLEKKQNGRRP